MTVATALQVALPAILGLLANKFTKTKDVSQPKFKTETIDQLLAGLKGEGPFANIFSTSPQAFQTSVADPLQQIFSQQTAPNIQQRFISQGQQRGTPLESSLTRAGTDVQSQINQLFLPFQQGQQNRSIQGIQSILGLANPAQQTSLTPFGGAAAGAIGSGGIPEIMKMLAGLLNKTGGQAGTGGGVSSGGQQGFGLPSFLEGRRGFN